MAKRAAPRAPFPSRRSERPRAAVDPPPPRPSSTSRPAPSPPSWGAKRARTAHGGARRPLWRDWAGLPDGPAWLVAERALAADVADYARFRAVCRAWRRCSDDPREHSSLDRRFHPRRWFMPHETPPPAAPHRRRFLNVATGQFVAIDLPELHGHCVFGSTAEGLLVLVDECTLVVRVLNPFTRQLTALPSLATLLPRTRLKNCLFSKKRTRTTYTGDLAGGDLSVKGAGLAGERTLALYFGRCTDWKLAVASPGDERWTSLHRGAPFCSVTSFAGRFYCVAGGSILTVSAAGHHPPRLAAAAKLARALSRMTETMHLVENGGELMLVHRSLWLGPGNNKYKVYRADLAARKTKRVHGLNGHAVFIGRCRVLSVSPQAFPTISADTIYPGFEPDEKCHEKIDAYHVADGSIEPSDFPNDFRVPRPYRIADYLSSCIRARPNSYLGLKHLLCQMLSDARVTCIISALNCAVQYLFAICIPIYHLVYWK
ncbi:hypothetical protein ACP4OV_018798 [Aristida adscensionis]